ncbi:MAG: hypothetical protein AUK47_17720 [Deltaproteobacteria bacterium CG2_30_63_29]|nr:MAG: hypothetical protein AUK47_17720 [Deltaproteobacteria bacterium CG2_30_63_29]
MHRRSEALDVGGEQHEPNIWMHASGDLSVVNRSGNDAGHGRRMRAELGCDCVRVRRAIAFSKLEGLHEVEPVDVVDIAILVVVLCGD